MKILQFSVRYWKFCGVYLSPSSTTTDIYLGLFSIFVLASALILHFSMSLLICLEIIEKDTVDMSQLFFPLLGVIGAVAAFGPYISTVLVRRNIGEMIELLQHIIHKRIGRHSHVSYENVEHRTYSFAKWSLILYAATFNGPKLITLTAYAIRDLILGAAFDPDNYYDLLKLSTPFDRTSITGYLQYCTLELYIANCFGAAYFCGFLLFISACMYLEALCDDFIENFEQLAFTGGLRNAETKQRLIDEINFQSEIDTLFKRLDTVSSGILLTTQVTACILISCSIFQVDNMTQTLDVTELITMIGLATMGISTVYPLCYFASRITAKLNQTAKVIYFSTWYSLPMELQKYMPFMIAFGQRDHVFRGMHMMTCSLESFLQIIKASASYYLMIKKIRV